MLYRYLHGQEGRKTVPSSPMIGFEVQGHMDHHHQGETRVEEREARIAHICCCHLSNDGRMVSPAE